MGLTLPLQLGDNKNCVKYDGSRCFSNVKTQNFSSPRFARLHMIYHKMVKIAHLYFIVYFPLVLAIELRNLNQQIWTLITNSYYIYNLKHAHIYPFSSKPKQYFHRHEIAYILQLVPLKSLGFQGPLDPTPRVASGANTSLGLRRLAGRPISLAGAGNPINI